MHSLFLTAQPTLLCELRSPLHYQSLKYILERLHLRGWQHASPQEPTSQPHRYDTKAPFLVDREANCGMFESKGSRAICLNLTGFIYL